MGLTRQERDIHDLIRSLKSEIGASQADDLDRLVDLLTKG